MSRSLCGIGLACLLVAGSVGPAAAQTVLKELPRKEASAADAQALAAKIDQLTAKRWAAAKATPAPRADDSEFLRRVYLDLAGRIPSVAETRAFLADKQSERRAKVIDRLLAGPRYAGHFAAVYRGILIPEAANNFIVRLQQDGFESWLRKQLADNVSYDRMTRDLLTASIGSRNDFEADIFGAEANPRAFFAAKEYKPENLAAGAIRVFLGVRLECAQCHDHKFAEWTREQFWSQAAFFAGIKGENQGDVIVAGTENQYKKDIVYPGSGKVIQASFLDGTKPNWDSGATSRATFAAWVTSPSNPYFARAAVNRTWAYFFGTGLVEPIDEMVGASTVESDPELLDLLAREFVDKQFDLKFICRALTLTEVYQRTSAAPRGEKTKLDPDPTKPALFLRMPLKGLTPEQLFDSLAVATGFRDTGDSSPFAEVFGISTVSARRQFVAKFTNTTERATMSRTSILQALSLMNGKVTADATSLERSETLAALLDAPFLTTADRVETLYLAAFSRRPNARELERATRFVDEAVRDINDPGVRTTTYGHAVADLFWVLLNSSEFVLNH